MNRVAVCRNILPAVRQMSSVPSGKNLPVHPNYAKTWAKYKKYQVPDGVPVHLKGGVMDTILYTSTVAMCGLGLVMMGEFFYTMITK